MSWLRSRPVDLHLSQEPEADALLSDNPFALVVGMVLDQQVPLEWAFASPLELQRRLGKSLDAKRIAQMDPEALAAAFSSRPALHRYPGSMAARVQELAKLVVERYGGRTEAIWTGATSGDDLLRRVKELPGFGEQKAKIFVALLGKQLGVRPDGLGHGERTVQRTRQLPLRGRHHRRGIAQQGAGVQTSTESCQQGQGVGRHHRETGQEDGEGHQDRRSKSAPQRRRPATAGKR